MTHEIVRTTVQLKHRIKEEAEELIRARHLVDIIEEMIDIMGWLEVGVRSLPVCEADLVGESVEKAFIHHEAKCLSRGLEPLDLTYQLIHSLIAVVELRKRHIIDPRLTKERGLEDETDFN